MRRSIYLAALAGAVWMLAAGPLAAAAAEAQKPYLTGRVVDEAGLLSPDFAQRISTRLEELEAETGAQVAVLTIPTLDGYPIEMFALETAERWALGRAQHDDGVLFLIVRDDRLMRIEVGYGLEGVIPDVLAGRILDQAVRPRFRAGEFDEGVLDGVNAIAGLVRGAEPRDVLPVQPNAFPIQRIIQLVVWIVLIFILIKGMAGRRRGGGWIVTGGAPSSSGGWSRGSSGGSFGGFSGGGGSFGGGGASSSW